MKKTLVFALASAALVTTSSVHASLNLVQDPGFEGGETGTLSFSSTPWFNPSGTTDTVINSSHPHTGSFNVAMTSVTGESAVLLQSLTLVPGQGYTINFWASTPGSGGSLEVELNGVIAGTVAIASESAYSQYNMTAIPVNASGVLTFLWNTTASPSTVDLDDIVVAVPEPTTMVAGALMLLPFAASTFRRRKKA